MPSLMVMEIVNIFNYTIYNLIENYHQKLDQKKNGDRSHLSNITEKVSLVYGKPLIKNSKDCYKNPST